jgi:Zn-dependent peptidase ImmA (M78 family)/DNA-binding XRE family transcriptional regulator
MFNPQRLAFARKRRGMNMTQLAKCLGVDLRSVSAYEKGEYEPKDDKLERIAQILSFPVSFFMLADIPELSPDTASFRAMSKMSASKRDIALSAGGIALLLNQAIESRFNLPLLDLPDLSREPNPEAAASALRRHWGIGELPVKNMIHLLESKGIRVYSLAIDAQEVDAFSLWREDQAFAFLNTRKSSERSRFDCGHELGHLVIHRHGEQRLDGSQTIEREADAFSSAFLMPRASVLGYAPRMPRLEELVQLKKIWGVSVAALNYRLHNLGITTDWHYRELAMQIARQGYRKKEPESVPRETSQILGKVLAGLREEGISKAEIAQELHVTVDELDDLVFGLAVTSLQGGKSNSVPVKRQLVNLKVIK